MESSSQRSRMEAMACRAIIWADRLQKSIRIDSSLIDNMAATRLCPQEQLFASEDGRDFSFSPWTPGIVAAVCEVSN